VPSIPLVEKEIKVYITAGNVSSVTTLVTDAISDFHSSKLSLKFVCGWNRRTLTYEVKGIWNGGASNTQQERLHINLHKKPYAMKLPLTGIWDANERG
jgi:hypothetical protein